MAEPGPQDLRALRGGGVRLLTTCLMEGQVSGSVPWGSRMGRSGTAIREAQTQDTHLRSRSLHTMEALARAVYIYSLLSIGELYCILFCSCWFGKNLDIALWDLGKIGTGD